MAIKQEYAKEFGELANQYQGRQITNRLLKGIWKEGDIRKVAMLMHLPEFRRDYFRCSKCEQWARKSQMAMGVKCGNRYVARVCESCLLQGKTVDEWARNLMAKRESTPSAG